MNIPITTVGSQVYVQIPTTLPTEFQNISPTNQDDVHICGVCKKNFSDINSFVEHKRSGCIRNAQKCPATTSTLLRQPSMSYLSTTSPPNSEDSPSPLGPPIFRVIVDGSNLAMQQGNANSRQSLSYKENGDSQILRSRLLGIQRDRHDEQQKNINNNSEEMQGIVIQQPHRQSREFQIDEEAVATILANQLANEDVTSPHPNMSSSRTGPILVLGNMDGEMGMPESRGPLDLGSIGLPSEEAVTMPPLEPHQRGSRGEPEYERESMRESREPEMNHITNNTSRKIVPEELKDSLWNPTSEKEILHVQEDLVMTSAPCSSPANVADISPSLVALSTMSRLRAKKRHDCTFDGCHFTTCYLKDLVRHMRRHTGERPFQCETCQRSFSRGDKLQMHLRIHSGVKPHRCDQCDYATIDSGSLRKHMRIHNDERPYKCQICPYRSRDSSQLTVHLRTHTGDNPFVCPYDSCSSAFKTSSDLKRHSRVHTGEKPFACELCDYKCAIKSNLRVHLRLNHTEAKSFPCSSCNHLSDTKRAAKDHEKIHAAEVLKCGACTYITLKTNSMKSHLKTHTQDRPFSCRHCPYTCRQQGNLKIHVRKKHSDLRSSKKGKVITKDSIPGKTGSSIRSVPKALPQSKPFCYKSYRCTSCDAAFVREDSWRSHMRQHQAHDTVLHGTHFADNLEQEIASNVESCEQQKAVEMLKTDNLHSTPDLLEQEHFMMSLGNQNQNSKEHLKLEQSPQKPKDLTPLPESVNKSTELKENNMKIAHPPPEEQESYQPVLLYIPTSEGGEDDSLRSAEILASLNQGTPVLVTGRCGQYMTVPSDQNLVEQLAASFQPGATYQYVLSSQLEGMVDNDGTFIQAAAANDAELGTHVDAALHIPSIISLHMEKQSGVEDKN